MSWIDSGWKRLIRYFAGQVGEGYLRFLEKREARLNSMLNGQSLNLGFLNGNVRYAE